MGFFKELLSQAEAFVFDVDGVFSNNKQNLDPSGILQRTMNVKDGYAVIRALEENYPIGIISGGNSEAVRKRFQDLGVSDIYLYSRDKYEDFKDFIYKYDLQPENVLTMGDDLPDYEMMEKSGIPTCPNDASEEIKSLSRYVSSHNGGEGCVRDVIEQVLRAQGKWLRKINPNGKY